MEWLIKELYDEGKVTFLKMEELPINNLSTDKCKMISLFIGLNPESSQYGDMLGLFKYDDRYYSFRFHVHRPNQRIADNSNKMICLDEVELETDEIYQFHYIVFSQTSFGNKAFWSYTPDSILDGEDYDLRQLMHKITAFSREHDYCKQLRKTDKQYLKLHM